ncbi:hypothetical protein OG21DRAFT_1527993 [Imleria badia]|nr:hypothetical protein OG21DRAFT_1527993 [Imleria badia]
MNRNGFSKELWKGVIRDLMLVDNILFTILPKNNIVVFSDDIVVYTPHGKISIKYKSLEDHPVIEIAAIHTTGTKESTDESRAFQYALHIKKVDTSTNESRPRVVPNLHNCATIEANINGCKAFIMIETSITSNFAALQPIKVHTWEPHEGSKGEEEGMRKQTSKLSKQHLAAIKTKETILMENNIDYGTNGSKSINIDLEEWSKDFLPYGRLTTKSR